MDLLKLKQFPSVSAGGVSTLVTDELLDRSVYGLIFERGGTFTDAHMENIRVRLDGKDLVNNIDGSQLADLNDYDGITAVSGYAALFFGDPTARTIRGQHLGDLDLSIYRKPLEIEVQVAAGATAPTLQVYALCGAPKLAMGVGFNEIEAATHRALVRSIIQPAAAVTRNQYGISLGSVPGARIRKIAFFHTNLTRVELKKQSLTKWDDVAAALNSAVQQYHARTPQAGLYVLDRVMDGNAGEAETTVMDNGRPWVLNVAVTTSGADTIETFADLHTTHAQL